jgi:hypothetical protein
VFLKAKAIVIQWSNIGLEMEADPTCTTTALREPVVWLDPPPPQADSVRAARIAIPSDMRLEGCLRMLGRGGSSWNGHRGVITAAPFGQVGGA